MKTIMKVLLPVFLVASLGGGCRVGRAVKVSYEFDLPNDLRSRGFRYIKKGVEARHTIKGIWPAHSRAKLCRNLAVPHLAYAKLWKAAGGLKDNQRLINVVVEATLISKEGFGREVFMVVQMYADLVEVDPSNAAVSKRFGDQHQSALRAMALIQRSIANLLTRQG